MEGLIAAILSFVVNVRYIIPAIFFSGFLALLARQWRKDLSICIQWMKAGTRKATSAAAAETLLADAMTCEEDMVELFRMLKNDGSDKVTLCQLDKVLYEIAELEGERFRDELAKLLKVDEARLSGVLMGYEDFRCFLSVVAQRVVFAKMQGRAYRAYRDAEGQRFLQDEDAEVGAEDVTLAARSLGFDISYRDQIALATLSSRRHSSDDDAASGGTEGEEADIVVRDVGGAPPTTKSDASDSDSDGGNEYDDDLFDVDNESEAGAVEVSGQFEYDDDLFDVDNERGAGTMGVSSARLESTLDEEVLADEDQEDDYDDDDFDDYEEGHDDEDHLERTELHYSDDSFDRKEGGIARAAQREDESAAALMRVPASAEVSSESSVAKGDAEKIGDPEKHEDSDEEYSTDMESYVSDGGNSGGDNTNRAGDNNEDDTDKSSNDVDEDGLNNANKGEDGLNNFQAADGTVSGFVAGIPKHLICSLTLELMVDPVLAEDGNTYERSEILKWINMSGTSPLDPSIPLDASRLVPNRAVKQLIEELVASTELAHELRAQYVERMESLSQEKEAEALFADNFEDVWDDPNRQYDVEGFLNAVQLLAKQKEGEEIARICQQARHDYFEAYCTNAVTRVVDDGSETLVLNDAGFRAACATLNLTW